MNQHPGQPARSVKRETLAVDRSPPHSPEAEEGTISCCLIDPNTCIPICIEKFCGHEAFFDPRRQDLFMVLSDMYDERTPIDEITLRQRLNDSGMMDAVGGPEYIQKLMTFSPTPANLPFYLDILWDQLALRRMLSGCSEVTSEIFRKDGELELESLIDQAERIIFSVGQMRFGRKLATTKSIVIKAVDLLQDMFVNRGKLRGIDTGLPDLNFYTGGLKGGNMYIFAGRPSTGKTSLAMNIAEYVAVNQKLPVGVFTLEMTAESLVLRMMGSMAKVNIRQVERGFFSEKDQAALSVASKNLISAPIYFEDESGMSILALRSKARRMVQLYGIKLFVIDYLQLLHSTNKKADSRQLEIADISSGIKQMAKELDVPVIVLCQLNRDIEKRTGAPRMSDLRESGCLEQDADLIGILAKKSDKPEDDPSSESESQLVEEILYILKQRNGPTGDINLLFRKSITKFESVRQQPELE